MVARNGSDRGKLAYQKAFNDSVVKKTIKNKVNCAVSENEDGDRGETMLKRMMGYTGLYWPVVSSSGPNWALLGCIGLY